MKLYIFVLGFLALPVFVSAHNEMMNWGGGFNIWTGAWVWLIFLSIIIWVIVGILAAVWLWQQIKKK